MASTLSVSLINKCPNQNRMYSVNKEFDYQEQSTISTNLNLEALNYSYEQLLRYASSIIILSNHHRYYNWALNNPWHLKTAHTRYEPNERYNPLGCTKPCPLSPRKPSSFSPNWKQIKQEEWAYNYTTPHTDFDNQTYSVLIWSTTIIGFVRENSIADSTRMAIHIDRTKWGVKIVTKMLPIIASNSHRGLN